MLAVPYSIVLAVPHPGLPPQAGEGDAATCSFRTHIWQHLPPPFMGEDRGGGKRAPTGSIFLPHSWGRTEEGDCEHGPRRGTASTDRELNPSSHSPASLSIQRRASARSSRALRRSPLFSRVPTPHRPAATPAGSDSVPGASARRTGGVPGTT